MSLYDEYEGLLQDVNAELDRVPVMFRGTVKKPLISLLELLGRATAKIDELEDRIDAKAN